MLSCLIIIYCLLLIFKVLVRNYVFRDINMSRWDTFMGLVNLKLSILSFLWIEIQKCFHAFSPNQLYIHSLSVLTSVVHLIVESCAFPPNNLISLSYSLPVFSANSFMLFFHYQYKMWMSFYCFGLALIFSKKN